MNAPAPNRVRRDCRHCAGRDDHDCGALCSVAAGRIASARVHRSLEPGETLFHQGDRNLGLYGIASGLVAIRILHARGVEAIIGLGRPGQVLGVRAFLRNRPHQSTAQALVASEVCIIRRPDALRLTRDAPGAQAVLTACCLKALDASHRVLLRNAALDARARLLCLLRELCEAEVGTPLTGPVTLAVPLSRGDMATMLGVKPESLSRLLRGLRDEGLARASGRTIVVPDHARLAAAAEHAEHH